MSVLRDVDQKVTVLFVSGNESIAFVAKQEGSAASEGVLVHGLTLLPYLNSTYFDSLPVESLFALC